jgi:CspA family cold shock protein
MTTQRSRMMGTRGVVKWFSSQKGFGFITPEGGGKDCVQIEGGKSLDEGDLVEFDVVEEERGPAATNVVRVPESEAEPDEEHDEEMEWEDEDEDETDEDEEDS